MPPEWTDGGPATGAAVLDATERWVQRPPLSACGLAPGTRARLGRILFHAGLRNGTALLLPYHRGVLRGPEDFLANPRAADPRYIIELAIAANFNAVVLPIGLAEKYVGEYAGEIPVIVTLNAAVPAGDGIAPLVSGVDEAVRLGADAVGFTIGPGAWDRGLLQFRQIRLDAARLGMPLFCWASTARQGQAHAARAAAELGADAVVVAAPETPNDGRRGLDDIVAASGRTLALLAGGPRIDEQVLTERAEQAMRAGTWGMSVGRNLWQRGHDSALRLAGRLRAVLESYPSEL